MNIFEIEKPRVIVSNKDSFHNYFAWPTMARLKDGRIAVAASGFRLSHICPFGKVTLSFSEDNGKTYTLPCPIIDTPLDDRDGGICAFGDSSVIVTSFGHSADFYRGRYSRQSSLRTEVFSRFSMLARVKEAMPKYFNADGASKFKG